MQVVAWLIVALSSVVASVGGFLVLVVLRARRHDAAVRAQVERVRCYSVFSTTR